MVGRAKPRRGFVSTSAYLAVPLNDSGFPQHFDFTYYISAVNAVLYCFRLVRSQGKEEGRWKNGAASR